MEPSDHHPREMMLDASHLRGTVSRRVGSAPYHTPGRPNPRFLPRAPRPATARPARELPPTPVTPRSPCFTYSPTPTLPVTLEESRLALHTAVSKDAKGYPVRHAKSALHSALHHRRQLLRQQAAAELAAAREQEKEREREREKEGRCRGVSPKPQGAYLVIPDPRVETALLEEVQALEYSVSIEPSTPHSGRLHSCAEVIDTLTRTLVDGPLSSFFKILSRELRAAVFCTADESNAFMAERGRIPTTYYELAKLLTRRSKTTSEEISVLKSELRAMQTRAELAEKRSEEEKAKDLPVHEELRELEEKHQTALGRIKSLQAHVEFLGTSIDELQTSLDRANERYYEATRRVGSKAPQKVQDIVRASNQEIVSVLGSIGSAPRPAATPTFSLPRADASTTTDLPTPTSPVCEAALQTDLAVGSEVFSMYTPSIKTPSNDRAPRVMSFHVSEVSLDWNYE